MLIRVGCSCFFEIVHPSSDAILSVHFFPFIKDVVNGDIRISSVILQIFHKLFFLLVKFMKDGVLPAVEVEGSDMMFFAQLDIEGGGGFDPFSGQIKFRVSMIDKQVGADKFQKFRGGQMIFNRGKPHSGGNTAGPSQGTQEAGLADTESPAGIYDIAGPVMLRKVKGIIGIIPDIVPNRVIEFYGFFNGIAACIFYGFIGIVDNCRMIAVDNRCG